MKMHIEILLVFSSPDLVDITMLHAAEADKAGHCKCTKYELANGWGISCLANT